MSQYTMTIDEIIKNGFNLFDFNYEFYDNEKKSWIENLFISYYFDYEIGFETIQAFQNNLEIKWKILLLKYNKLFIANDEQINIFNTVKSEIKQKAVIQETPDSELSNTDYASNITENTQTNNGYNNITEIELLDRYNTQLINIALKFIEEFTPLFMRVY